MSNIELYQPLLELSIAITQCKEELIQKPNSKRESELKKAIQNMEEKINEKSVELVDKTVDTWDSNQSLSSYLNTELNSLKEAADESWHSAIDDVKQRLVNLAETESKKSPRRRKLERNAWWIGIVLVAIIMCSLKWYWLVEVNQPIETTQGVVQRAKSLEKLLDYDDSMDTHVRRGGWLKGILFWPAEPTEKEINYASEFLWSTVDVYDYLLKENTLCGSQISHNSKDDNMKDEIAISQVVINYLKTTNPTSSENGARLIANAFISKFPCK